jgi:hypothetical protein
MLNLKISKTNIKRLITCIFVGALLGALLGNTVLLKYKSEGVLSLDMSVAEYKRFSESVSDIPTLKQMITALAVPAEDSKAIELAVKNNTNKWHTAVPRLSKAEAKDLPEALQKLALESDRPDRADKNDRGDRGDRNDKNDKNDKSDKQITAYVGVRVLATGSDAEQTSRVARWMGQYFKELAAKEAVREQLFSWISENRQFSERAQERKLKLAYDIEQAKNRSNALKQLLKQYPYLAKSEANQVVDVRRENEKFMSPSAQLVGAESEIIDLNEKLSRLARESQQQVFAQDFLVKAETALFNASSGTAAVKALRDLITATELTVKNNAEKEKILGFAGDISKISARFLSQAQFVVPPAAPERPEQPRPLVLTVIFAFLSGLMALLWIYKDLILAAFKEEPAESANGS